MVKMYFLLNYVSKIHAKLIEENKLHCSRQVFVVEKFFVLQTRLLDGLLPARFNAVVFCFVFCFFAKEPLTVGSNGTFFAF